MFWWHSDVCLVNVCPNISGLDAEAKKILNTDFDSMCEDKVTEP